MLPMRARAGPAPSMHVRHPNQLAASSSSSSSSSTPPPLRPGPPAVPSAGDLKNADVKASFGFDTACKVFSEMIGNIMIDAMSAKKYYHFVRRGLHMAIYWVGWNVCCRAV